MVESAIVRYRSKVDWWLAAIIVLVPLVALASAIALQVTEGGAEAIVGWVVVVGVIGLYVGIVWPVAYELHPDELVVRFGLLRSRVPYRSIRAVRPSRSLIASPALSMDRLAIDVGPRLPMLISPEDRDRFLDDLAARAPQLTRVADELVSVSSSMRA